MNHFFIFFCCISLLAAGCGDNATSIGQGNSEGIQTPDEFYHYSLWAALVNKIYDGNLTVREAKSHGDIGLGTYNGADGELILLDGVFYHVPASGEVLVADVSDRIPYLNATFFDKEFAFEVTGPVNYDTLRKLIQQKFPSRNYFYAFKIHGEFDSIRVGSLHKQERPYQYSMDSLLPTRPTFDHRNISGTMVGFYCPDFIGDINVAGFHLHFMSDDRKTGGHVMEFTGKNFDVGMDKLTAYQFVLPQTPDYDSVNLEKKYQYGKK